ncbi:phage tail protein [Actinokineospora sp. NBRC 105648]|uniref:phage tail protein n=1 Tax=Actinokineospora sp. NBRC 105648 TaxID=3032206 RepID=UPI0024A00583|nr:phage tail protein [Actinokineospora sp. NBRC 105648]GLZ39456.1 phage tail protein [Actinokineospora sp. NBRC 105648]
MLSDSSKIGLSNRFVVVVQNMEKYNLGSWTKAEGLDVSWDVAEYRSGDGGNDRFYFPGNTKYNNVKLSRAVSDETTAVRDWLNKNSWDHKLYVGTIKLHTSLFDDGAITEWELRDVIPVKWAITTMDAGASQVAIETLELAHRGFLEDQRRLPV